MRVVVPMRDQTWSLTGCVASSARLPSSSSTSLYLKAMVPAVSSADHESLVCVERQLLLAARRPVFKAAVVIAATPRWADWFLRFWKVEGDRFDYLRRLAPLDPIEAAGHLQAETLWQFSERDFFIAPMSALELARAAPGEPSIEWYRADHAMRSARARAARAAFLAGALGLG